MEPRIQYAKTKDGVSIAYSVTGEGPPLVFMPNTPLSQIDPRAPFRGGYIDSLAQRRLLVRYDSRGCGLSDREVPDYSLDAHLVDLDAVVTRLELQQFALLAPVHLVPAAIAYVVRWPERVSRLVLISGYACGQDFLQSPELRALGRLIEKDWVLWTEALTHAFMGWSRDDEARRIAEFLRESVTPESARKFYAAAREFDVRDLLAQVNAPTLVLQHRELRWPNMDIARGLAAAIPDARLAILEGTGTGFLDDAATATIDEFLDEGEEAAPERQPASPAVHTILFTDIEGSTAMTQRLGDAKAREVLREHERITRECLRSHGGSEVKTMGDGFMASFGSATKALECAIDIQRAFAERNASLPAHPEALEGRAEPQPPAHASTGSARADGDVGASPEPIRVRIGLNAGEPIAEDDPDGRSDLFGTAVNLAARIAAQAQGGEVLASDVVRQLVAGKGFLFADRGDVALRGFEDPVRLYEVRWRSEPVEGQA